MFIQDYIDLGACQCINWLIGLVLPRMASVPFTTSTTDNQKDREQDQCPPDKNGQEDQQEDIAILCPWRQRDVLGKHQRKKQTSQRWNSFSEYNRMTSIFTLYRFLQLRCQVNFFRSHNLVTILWHTHKPETFLALKQKLAKTFLKNKDSKRGFSQQCHRRIILVPQITFQRSFSIGYFNNLKDLFLL